MANYTATGPTLANVAANDVVSYHGGKTTVSSVGSVTTNQGGTIDATVTLADGKTITMSSKNTILSGFSITQAGARVATWVYSE